jgi:hypothetical protein
MCSSSTPRWAGLQGLAAAMRDDICHETAAVLGRALDGPRVSDDDPIADHRAWMHDYILDRLEMVQRTARDDLPPVD